MKNNDLQIDVVVLAAGKGVRMQSATNKMFQKINGIPILYRTLSRMNSSTAVKRIIPVIQQSDMGKCENMIREFGDLSKIKSFVWGGEERSDSVRNGLKYAQTNSDSKIIMTHDGARPFFSEDLLQRLSASVAHHTAAIPVLGIFETIRYQPKNLKARVVDRDSYFITQTPQAFLLSDINACFLSSEASTLDLSDEAAYFEHKKYSTELIEGEKWNIKVTTQEDIAWGELLLNYYPSLRLSNSVER